MILRAAAAAAALLALGIAQLLPENGVGLYVRLVTATTVVLLPGGLVATALGLRSMAARIAWSFAAVGAALTVVFVLTSSLALAYPVLLAIGIGAFVLGARRPRLPLDRIRGSAFVLAAGIVLGVLLWHVAPGDVQGDGLFHVARVRKLVELGDLHPGSLNELVGGGLHPGYAFPLWHAFLALVARLGGVDPSLVVQHEGSVLAPLALLVAYEAGATLFRSSALGVATMLAQVALICFAPGHGGAYTALALPATAARQLLVPAVLTLVFSHVRERSWRTLASAGAGALVLALVHPTYAIFLCIPLVGWLVARAAAQPRDARGIAEGLGAVAVPAAGVALSLLPYARDTVSHDPSAAELERAFRHYGKQLVVDGDRYHLAPEVFARSGAVAVAALVLVPFAVLAWRRRWSAFVLGGSLAVLVPMLVPFLFMELSDAVSISQARRAAGFLPFAFAFAGGVAVLSRALAILVLPLALAAGIVLQLLWPGDFGYTLEHGGPALAAWIALAVGGIVFIAVLVTRRAPDIERPGVIAALAAALFVAPVAVHGFGHWSPARGDDPNKLTPGLVHALREDVPERAVIFSDLETSYRIAAAAPVLLVAAPPAHVADTKANRPHERRLDVLAFLRRGDLAIPRRYGAAWLVVDRKRHSIRVGLRPVYRDERYSLYRI